MVRVKELLTQAKPLIKPILIVFGVILIAMWALMAVNVSYVDDLARAAEGYKGWGNFSRYLSNLLAMFVNGNGFLTDISPWPQVLAALIMATAGVLLLYIIYDRTKFRWWELGVVAMLALNPYFWQCLSYKFDAPFIAVSVLMMVVPFLLRKEKTWIYVGAVMLGTLATCMTYQASLGIVPIVTVILAFLMWSRKEDGKEIGKFILKTLIGYGIGIVVFRVFLMKSVDAYVTTGVPGLMELVPHTLANLGQYYKILMDEFTTIWLGLIGLILVGFVVMVIMRTKQQKVWTGVMAVLTVLCMAVLCFGIYPLLERPLFAPRAMYGVGVAICLLAIVMVEETKLGQKWQRHVYSGGIVVSLVLVYLFGVFGLTYGNALAVQRQYADFRMEMVIDDLTDDLGLKEGDTVSIAGSIGKAPALLGAMEKYPLLKSLVPVDFESGYWGSYRFFRYYGLRSVEGDLYVTPPAEDFPVVKEYYYHNIRSDAKGRAFLVELKEVW